MIISKSVDIYDNIKEYISSLGLHIKLEDYK